MTETYEHEFSPFILGKDNQIKDCPSGSQE